jgi:hypothetical protein
MTVNKCQKKYQLRNIESKVELMINLSMRKVFKITNNYKYLWALATKNKSRANPNIAKIISKTKEMIKNSKVYLKSNYL